MSYIRNTQNPEKLYIWSDCVGVNIMKGSTHIGIIPQKIFDGLIKKYVKNYHPDKCKFKGAKIKEIYVDENGEKVSKKTFDKPNYIPTNGNFQIRLSYNNFHVDMWDVTWYYIAVANAKFKKWN